MLDFNMLCGCNLGLSQIMHTIPIWEILFILRLVKWVAVVLRWNEVFLNRSHAYPTH